MIRMEKDGDGWTDKAMENEVLERNKNLNRGFRKLRVWQEAIELYVFVKVDTQTHGRK